MKRPVESTEDFKARIAAIIGDKPERITGGERRPNPLLVRNKRVIRAQKRRRR
jgi:hypothetical protein